MVSNYIKASLACPDDSGIVFTIKQKAHAAWIKCLICNQSGAECLRCRLRSRAVKRAYFALAYNCYARTSGAAAHGAGFLRPPTRPLRCALRLLYQNFLIYFSIKLCRTGKLPVPITFTRGKARLLCINFYCYARTSGAAAHERRFPTSADTPLAVRFTAIALKLTSSFFYQAFPHLM